MTSPREPIAIVGIGCRFPGESRGPQSYWKFLTEGTDAVTEVPPDRWLVDAYYHPDHHAPGGIYTRWGGFIRDIDQFDAGFFGISPREAARMDPQQRLLLEVADEAFQDAGWPPTRHAGSNTGVFVGLSTCDYAGIQTASSARNSIDAFTNLGVGSCIAANRISYHYDFHGPSFVVDTACSSSLVAVSMACKAIWNGECEVALSGAVNLILRPENTMGFSKSQMLSPQGRCKSFDADASGYVRSEGVGAVVLRPLSQALAAGDRIYAVIRAADLNQDGRTGGIALPNGEAQAALLQHIYAGAGLDPAHVRYVEAHGTGTAAGDPIEVNALGSVLRADYQVGGEERGAECLIGSVKSNMGHLEAASGMAGLIKAALCLHHREIPGNLHFSTPNPAIPFERYGLRVAVGRQPWPTDPDGSQHFLAGINSFGFGGTNAHVVLDTAPAVSRVGGPPETPADAGALLFPFSAHSQEALRLVAQTSLESLLALGDRDLPDLAYTLGQHRDHHAFRLSLAASRVDELREGLQAFLDDEHRPGMAQGRVLSLEGDAPDAGLPLAFVFSGMGPQWWAMGRELLASEPVFRGAVEEIDALLTPSTGWSLLEELGRPEAESRIDETYIAQPALFAVQVALARLWGAWGVTPDVIVGHSLGEVAAAHVAGALSLPDAAHLIYQRSRLQHLTSGQGRMLAAELSPEQARAMLAQEPAQVSVAAINSATDLTLAGDAAGLERLAEQLDARGIFNSFLKVEVPFHSPVMEQIRTPFFAAMQGLIPRSPRIPMVSTVSGRFVEGAELDVTYWWRNIRESVQFSAAIGQILAGGPHVLLEISAHPALSGSMGRCIRQAGSSQARQSSVALPSLRRREPERVTLLGSLGRLYTLGRRLDWARIHAAGEGGAGGSARRLDLPLHPWQHERYWNETPLAERERLGLKLHPLLGERLGLPQPVWENTLNVFSTPELQGHVVQGAVVFPGAGFVEMALAAARETFLEEGAALHDLNFLEALVLPPAQSRVIQSVQDSRHTLSIYSAAPADLDAAAEGAWTLHARTTLSRLGGSRPVSRNLQTYRANCAQEVPRGDFYARFHALGLQYGPAFQGLERLWTGEGEALGQLRGSGAGGLQLPPPVLDACFQLLLGAVASLPQVPEGRLYLPVQIRKLTFYAALHGELYAHARLTRWDEGRVSGDLTLMNAEGEVFAEVSGLQCQAIDAAGAGLDSLLYRYRWEHRPLTGSAEPPVWGGAWPAPGDLLPRRADTLRRVGSPQDRSEFGRLSARLAALYSQSALRGVRAGAVPGDLLTAVRELAASTEAAGTEAVEHPDEEAAALWRSLWARFPGHQAELHLLASGGNTLHRRLRGQEETPSAGLQDHLRQDSPGVRSVHALTHELVRSLLSEGAEGAREVRVLEVGAAGGDLSAALAGVLSRSGVSWTQADRDPELLAQAAARLGLPGVPAARGLDLSRDLAEQGWEGQTYDLIVGADVPGSPQELERLGSLLVPGGVLALQQTLQTPAWQRLWPELQRPVQPLADWMARQGFEEVWQLPDAPEPELAFRSLVWGRAPVARKEAAERPPVTATSEAGRWLILADDPVFAACLETELRRRDQAAQVAPVPPPGPDQVGSLGSLLTSPTFQEGLTGVVFACPLDLPPGVTSTELQTLEERGAQTALALAQALARTQMQAPPALWLVTRGAQAVAREGVPHPLSAELWGLGRVLQMEYPVFSPRSVDLDPQRPASDSVPDLARELLSAGAEDELAFRGNGRFVHRLTRPALETLTPPPAPGAQEGAYRLAVPRPGVLSSLTHEWVPRRAPGAGEIEVRVQAAALNFKDIMLGMGMLPDEALEGGYTGRAYGMEAAGEVVRLGEGVGGLKVGDRVVICARDALSTHLTVPATFAVRTPAHLSSEAAASIPIAFMTAYYALHHLARLGPDDRVLIHAAAGGVGLAAIALAQRAGATIFATAGTPEKRELLRALGVPHVLDSRTLNFAEEILEITGGRGVDIVLNSLSGDAIGRSLAVLSPYGRFVEIGKRDIYQNSPLDLGPFRNNLSYFAVDLDRMWVDRPQLTKTLLSEVMALFERQELAPISHRVFPFQGALRAFRFMAQAKHTGKVVLAMDDQTPPQVTRPAEALRLRADGFYLLTGGLGGFGLALAAWLVDHGARRLVLIGRSGAGTDQARLQVGALRARGAEVRVERADIADEAALSGVLDDLRRSGPLLGVFHAAMVIDDALVEGLTPERFAVVTRPKVQGGWNLHRLTLGDPLEVFVGFSSVSAMVGNIGQASYAAANAFLDALADHRQGLGLPALTVSWGAVADVGYLTGERGVAARLESAGVPPVPVARLLAALEALWFTPAAALGVAAIHWPQLVMTRGFALPPRLHGLLGAAEGEARGQQGSDMLGALAQLDPEERRATLFARVSEQLARILGTSPGRLDPDQAIMKMGVDSLMAVELGGQIQAETGVKIPPMKFVGGVTLRGLTEFVLEGLDLADAAEATPALETQVSALPEDQLDALLSELLGEEARPQAQGGA